MTGDATTRLLAALAGASDEQKERALSALLGQPSNQPSHEYEAYLTLKDLADRLNFHPTTLWRWRVPGHDLAGRRRFKLSEVQAYLTSEAFRLRVQALRHSRAVGRASK